MLMCTAVWQAATRSQMLRFSVSALLAGDTGRLKLPEAMQLAEDACQLSEQLQVSSQPYTLVPD